MLADLTKTEEDHNDSARNRSTADNLDCTRGNGVAIGIVKHGESRDSYNMWHSLINITLAAGLLYWGGFFTA